MEFFPRYWFFVRGIHQWPVVDSPRKGKWRGAMMFSLICSWTNNWANNRDAGDLRRHRTDYDVIEMVQCRAILERYIEKIHSWKWCENSGWQAKDFIWSMWWMMVFMIQPNILDDVTSDRPPQWPWESLYLLLKWVYYDDVRMGAITSQITSLTIVYSTVYSDADQRKHQSSASLAFVWGIHRDRWIPRTKGQLRGKCFHLMTSSWWRYIAVGDASVT